MKKYIAGGIALNLLCLLTVFPVQAYRQSKELMSREKVCQRWGEHPLDIERFKYAENNETLRAKMACSLLNPENQKIYAGKSAIQIRNIFGFPDGYYMNEAFAAYLIETADQRGQDSWQILFLLDSDRKVSEIVVHKNCC